MRRLGNPDNRAQSNVVGLIEILVCSVAVRNVSVVIASATRKVKRPLSKGPTD
jgi:hypothetical protein